MGIEPTLEAWEAAVLPLNYTRPGVVPRPCAAEKWDYIQVSGSRLEARPPRSRSGHGPDDGVAWRGARATPTPAMLSWP